MFIHCTNSSRSEIQPIRFTFPVMTFPFHLVLSPPANKDAAQMARSYLQEEERAIDAHFLFGKKWVSSNTQERPTSFPQCGLRHMASRVCWEFLWVCHCLLRFEAGFLTSALWHWAGWFFVGRGRLMHCRMYSSISGLCPLSASGWQTVVTNRSVSRHFCMSSGEEAKCLQMRTTG